MSDTLTAPATPGPSGAPATLAEAAPSLAEQLYSTPPVEPSPEAVPAEATASTPEQKPAESEPAPDEGPEYIQGDDGQWRRADGTFATAEERAQIDAQLAEAEQAKAEHEKTRAATIVEVRGRNGEMVEVEAPDEETAQLLRQNVNDGMRRRDFLERTATLDARESIITHAESMIEHNPIGFVQENLTTDQQVELAIALLGPHFKTLIPIIQQFDADPDARMAAIAQSQLRIKQQTDAFSAHSAAQQSAASVRRAVAALIPETIAQDVAERFWADASVDVQRAIAQGAQVTPETVPQLLANRLSLYGFAGAAKAAPQRPRITLAKSGSSTPAAPAAGAVDPAKANQRLRLVQQQRRNAAAIPPHGRGGPAKPAAAPTDRAFQDAAHLLYGGTTRAS